MKQDANSKAIEVKIILYTYLEELSVEGRRFLFLLEGSLNYFCLLLVFAILQKNHVEDL
jgi:hypothetical protein